MVAEDFFKRYVEAGASVLGISRERAEGIVREFVASGEVAKEQANKAADWLVERGRTGAEELAEVVRRELRQQVSAMGLATRADMARLEARVDAAEAMLRGPDAPGQGGAQAAKGRHRHHGRSCRRDHRRRESSGFAPQAGCIAADGGPGRSGDHPFGVGPTTSPGPGRWGRPTGRRPCPPEGLTVLRRRLDTELVRRGLVPSRDRAQEEIAAGRVMVGGAVAEKASRLVAPGESVSVEGPPARFVSRGGEKLDAALAAFPVAVNGVEAVDAGASTGGFTDCLLQRGAAAVVAVDVGRGQIHQRLRTDPRVTVVERTNVRFLTLADLHREERPFPLVVADLSFISLTGLAEQLVGLAAPGADLVVLIKPQFEAGRVEATRGRGVITDPEVWRHALVDVIGAFAAAGAAMMGIMVSPLLGARGNVEFLAHLVADPVAPSPELDDAIDAVVDDGVALRAAAIGGSDR